MVEGCAPSQLVKVCDVRLQKFDWVKYLSQYSIEEISDIWENVRTTCLRMREDALLWKTDFDKEQVKEFVSEGSFLKMGKTVPKTSVCHSFEAALDNGLIKAAIRDTLVEFSAIKCPTKHPKNLHNHHPASDPRSVFLSNFGLKPAVGNSEGCNMKPRRASKRLKSLQSDPSPSLLVSELSSILADSEPGEQPSKNSCSLLSHKSKVGKGDLIRDKVETINENFQFKDASVKDCYVSVRRMRIHRSIEQVEEGDGGIDELVQEVHELAEKEKEHQVNDTTDQGEGGSSGEKSTNNELNVISDCVNSSFDDVSDAVMDIISRLDDEAEVVADIDKDASREYVEPGLDDMKNCLDLNETVRSVRNDAIVDTSGVKLHVTDYGCFRVTRSRSEPRSSAPLTVSSESTESFREYKRRMQLKLKANLASASLCEGEDMDIDSDGDEEHSVWQPSKNDENDTIFSDEEDSAVTRINLDGIMENYKCNNCNKVYQKSGHLLNHMRSCSGTEIKLEYTEQDSDRQCNQCGVFFATAGSCRRHLVNIHTQNISPQKKWSKRSREVKLKKALSESLIEKNSKEQLECLKCKRKFVKSGHLVNHMKSVHQSVEEFAIPCFQGPDMDTNNQCDVCFQSFATPASLRRHQIVHDRVFVKKERLSPSKSNQLHACKVCDKRYITKPSLKRHILTEHRGFKSTCKLCGLAVARLDNHMVLAHADQLVTCKICDKQLAPSSMSRHISTVHMGCLVRCVECDMFVSNIHKHMAHAHAAEKEEEDSHTDHLNCDCVFFLGPSRFFLLKEEEEE